MYGAITVLVLRSLWVACVLCMAVPTAAWAQSAPSAAQVDKAQTGVATAEQKVTQLAAQRGQLMVHYQQQLSTIDGFKKQKASWRRDRELGSAQADANDTAKRLTALDKQLASAQQALFAAKKSAVAAIDAEVAAGSPRSAQLAKLRARLAPPLPAPKKIVIPDAEIDPLADPQDLDQQATAIAAVEKQLEAQRVALDTQQKDLTLVAELRSAHERTGELSTRDDDQPQRGAAHSGGARETSTQSSPTAGSPTNGGGAGSGAGNDSSTSTTSGGGGGETFGATGDKSAASTFEANTAVALGEVIDRTTIDGLVRASRSGDPRQRAEAAKQARDAVAKRLELLKKKRAMIEARAKQLRGR